MPAAREAVQPVYAGIESIGTELTPDDLAGLARSWITPQMASEAMLRRVTSIEGAQLIGRSGVGNYSGIAFPYIWPGEAHVREYRVRRDQPDIEYDRNGQPKEKAKYLSPPGRGNFLYFVPGTPAQWLEDVSVPVFLVEGEKKTLALSRLAHLDVTHRSFLPVGIAGVWNWRGNIGKTEGPRGERRNVKGPIP